MENCQTLEDLMDYTTSKLLRLQTNYDLEPLLDNDDLEEVEKLSSDIREAEILVDELKNKLRQRKENIIALKEVRKNMRLMTKKLDFAFDNIPDSYPAKKVMISSPIVEQKETSRSILKPKDINITTKPVKPVKQLAKRLPMPCEMSALKVDEFKHVPSYLKGRILYENINKTITQVNETFSAKYTIMTTPRPSLTVQVRNKISAFKENDTKDTKGLFYIVEDDIKRFTSMKWDRTALSHMAILRHCQRIKEIRANSIIRYVLN